MKAELVPVNGDPPIPITRDVTVVGRREYCDVQIPHASLSKRHCVLVRTDGLLMVRDLATTNGTKVNGQRVMWAALLPNDRISLGGYKMRVYLGPDTQPSPSEKAMAQAVPRPAPQPHVQIFAPPTPDPQAPPGEAAHGGRRLDDDTELARKGPLTPELDDDGFHFDDDDEPLDLD